MSTKVSQIANNMISEHEVRAESVGADSLLSIHLLQEWEAISSETDSGAKLVSQSLVNDEVDLGEGCRGRQDRNTEEGKSELITDLGAYIRFIKSENVKAGLSFAKAKHTDEFPIMSAEGLKRALRVQTLDTSNKTWLKYQEFVENVKGKWCLKSSVESVYKLLVDLVVTLVLFGYEDTRQNLIERLDMVFLQWLRMLKELNFSFIKLAKYKLAAFAAYAKQSSMMPKTPFTPEFIVENAYAKPRFIFDRDFSVFMDKQAKRQGRTVERLYYMSFVDSICRGLKKGSDRPTDEEVHKSNLATLDCFSNGVLQGRDWESVNEPYFPETHCESISRGRSGNLVCTEWDPVGFITPNPEHEVLRTVDEIVPPGTSTFQPSWHRMPSLSACYENKYANGGGMLSVKNQLEARNGIIPRSLYGKVRPGFFQDLCELQNDADCGRPATVNTLDGSHDVAGSHLEFSTNYENLSNPHDIEDLFRMLADRYEGATYTPDGVRECRLGQGEGLPRMTILGLKEALKIRGITKGEAMENWLLQPLQKFLAQQLLKFPCFAVTHRPLVAEDLNQLFKSMEKGTSFLSGDYDNATNMMYSHYTEVAVRRICENLGLSEAMTTVAVYSLTKNIVEYKYIDPLTRKLVIQKRFQENAQPMGKILSFVILCIINAAVCRKAVEVDSGNRYFRVKLKHFKGLINGDDCCFALRDFESWSKMSLTVGLENSVGKTFFSPEFIEMNSRSFVIDVSHEGFMILPGGDRIGLKFLETPFINFGLLKGLIRSTSQAAEALRFERFCSLGECHTDLVRNLPFLWEPLDFIFKRYNADLLTHRRLDGIPYYVPKRWGGLGMHPGPQPKATITRDQRRALHWIAKENLRLQYVGNARTCLVHDKVTKVLDELINSVGLTKTRHQTIRLVTGEVVSLEKENQKVYTQLVERCWNQEDARIMKTDIEEDTWVSPEWASGQEIASKSDLQILINKRQIYRKLRENQRVWKQGFHSSQYCTLEATMCWSDIFKQKEVEYYPIIAADSVRDMNWSIQEI